MRSDASWPPEGMHRSIIVRREGFIRCNQEWNSSKSCSKLWWLVLRVFSDAGMYDRSHVCGEVVGVAGHCLGASPCQTPTTKWCQSFHRVTHFLQSPSFTLVSCNLHWSLCTCDPSSWLFVYLFWKICGSISTGSVVYAKPFWHSFHCGNGRLRDRKSESA